MNTNRRPPNQLRRYRVSQRKAIDLDPILKRMSDFLDDQPKIFERCAEIFSEV